ncbi:MAG: FkbM family methyltransferase [Actinomycetota bacterium]
MFRLIQHYAHAAERRASLVCELGRAARLGKTLPARITGRVLRQPHAYEDKILLLRLLDPSAENLLIDVGGNTGYWCESFLEFFPKSRVVAFEPLEPEFEAYRRRFKNASGITVHNVGLSDRSEVAPMHVADNSAHSSLHRHVNGVSVPLAESGGGRDVRLETLDSFRLGSLPAARKLLKIDVQGHELNVLRGATETLPHIDVALVECSFLPQYEGVVPSFAQVTALLREFDIYPVMFRDYGVSLGPHAWERDVIFCRQELLDLVWGW